MASILPQGERPAPVNLDPDVHVPPGLLDQAHRRMFPHMTLDDLRVLMDHGWARAGVATAVVNERGEVLMLDHAESPKLTEGAVGPLMETSRVHLSEGVVESTEQTIHRALQEELGIEDPEKLKLRARLYGAWTLHGWQAGDKKTGEMVFGVNPVVVMPNEVADTMKRRPFVKTDEIRTATFHAPEIIQHIPKLRPGVLGWLGGLSSLRLLESHGQQLHPLHFDVDGMSDPGWQDAVFADLSL